MENDVLRVIIVGGGLVGSLCACFMARRGYHVDLYEQREDIRKLQQKRGRSINLALSNRGRDALRLVNLEDIVLQHAIPLKGRFIHDSSGKTYSIPYDKFTNQCIYSISRKFLNELLLSAAEKCSNVSLWFNCKVISADPHKGNVTIQQKNTSESKTVNADMVIGADGSHSIIRLIMQQHSRFQFTQNYIDHGYLELQIPAETGRAMVPNHLHIWPRGECMLIALPNHGGNWTATLFMPYERSVDLDDAFRSFYELMRPGYHLKNRITSFMHIIMHYGIICQRYFNINVIPVRNIPKKIFNQTLIVGIPKVMAEMLGTLPTVFYIRRYFESDLQVLFDIRFHKITAPNDALEFFEATFPDAVDLIGMDSIQQTFSETEPSYLMSVKCDPYHLSKFVLIGDAAHAMVPFYGQGMNAGFEDCVVLDQLLDSIPQNDNNIEEVLSEFSSRRVKDAHAICELAMYNYVEMRQLVTKRSFLLRKKFDEFLFSMAPKFWIPLYHSVTFSRTSYKECIENREWQNKVINIMLILFIATVCFTGILMLAD